MGKRTLILFIIFILNSFIFLKAQTDSAYYFFNSNDISSLCSSAQTEWGKQIVASMRNMVEERLKHPMEVPMLEGGYGHDYFCPVHNQLFSFDWNKPTAHYCSLCGKDWTHVNRYNWAWVNMVHDKNLSFLISCMYLYIITGDRKYADYIKDMMLDYALKYPTYMEHNRERECAEAYSGKMFAQSLDEAVWASYASKAYLTAKPAMSKEDVGKIEKGYLQECVDMLLKRKAKGNWQVWHNSGLIALSVALGNDSIIDIALNDPQYGYHYLMDNDVRSDGWWNEGSPIYHYYPLRAMVLSAEALRCKNINLYDEKLKKMLVAPAAATYANLQFPAHNDGWYGESLVGQAPLYEIACKRYNDIFFLDILKRCYRLSPRISTDALLNNIEIAGDKRLSSRRSIDFEETGFAVLCSEDKTVVFKYGPHGGLHGHPDKLSISVHDGEKEILSDLGTTAYGVPDCQLWYRKTLSHSTLSVDMEDQRPTTGKLIRFEAKKNGGYVEAETTEAYPGVYMSRSILFEGNQMTDIFTASSDDEHIYDYVLIFTEKPQFASTGQPFEFNDPGAYSRISGTEIRKIKKNVTFKIGNTEIKLQLLTGESFDLIVGEAPGIPPKDNIDKDSNGSFTLSYPLVIRTKNKNMKIKAEWKLQK